jgi:hypothetical protein
LGHDASGARTPPSWSEEPMIPSIGDHAINEAGCVPNDPSLPTLIRH